MPQRLPEVEHHFGIVPYSSQMGSDSDIPKRYSSPITLFDRHSDDSLFLKKVMPLPPFISTKYGALSLHRIESI